MIATTSSTSRQEDVTTKRYAYARVGLPKYAYGNKDGVQKEAEKCDIVRPLELLPGQAANQNEGKSNGGSWSSKALLGHEKDKS